MTVLLVTDLKQYTYCPRIIYYAYCLPDLRPTTPAMQLGRAAHQAEEGREQRRSLRAYGLKQGERAFDVWLESEQLGLRGKVDMTICIAEPPEAIPVEYKDSTHQDNEHWVLQLTAYGMLLEEQSGLPVRRGFFYYIPLRHSREISLTAALRAKLRRTVDEIRAMIAHEHMPDPPATRARCVTCEFRRFCNDL